jgi:Mlc titration factor MtfA (ptsG expression regulator)
MFRWLTRYRRRALRLRPFPSEWRAILERNVPWLARLSPEDQAELHGHVQVLLAEKRFEGAGGLEITDEVRVTVAALACVLLLHRRTDYYPNLVSIVVYPSAYLVPGGRRNRDGYIDEDPRGRQGESWRDLVVLAWDGVLAGAAGMDGARNLVFHEFAHQLDRENGRNSGTPVLPRRSMYKAWGAVLSREFEELIREANLEHSTLIRQYGATSPAEFFAVVTEHFFMQPRALQARHPELYGALRQFYQQDPAVIDPGARLTSRAAPPAAPARPATPNR